VDKVINSNFCLISHRIWVLRLLT